MISMILDSDSTFLSECPWQSAVEVRGGEAEPKWSGEGKQSLSGEPEIAGTWRKFFNIAPNSTGPFKLCVCVWR